MKTMLALVAALALPSLALADGPMKTGDSTTKTAPAPKTGAAKMDDADVKLIAHVHHVNGMEMDMGKLAAAKATGGVRTYGQTLMKDHQDGDKDLVAFAKKKGVATIPADVPPTEADKKEHADMMAKMAELKKLKGADFDKMFLDMMVAGHDKEIARLDAALPMIKDADLAAKMKDLRPVLQRHADTARDLMKNAPTASTDAKSDTKTASKTDAKTKADAKTEIKDTKVGAAVTDKK